MLFVGIRDDGNDVNGGEVGAAFEETGDEVGDVLSVELCVLFAAVLFDGIADGDSGANDVGTVRSAFEDAEDGVGVTSIMIEFVLFAIVPFQ